MKQNFVNQTHVSGYLYEHELELRETGANSKNPGTQYITGTISIATDEALTNIVKVHYTYVTATTAKGSANANFTTLMNIIDGNYKTVMAAGKDAATKLRADASIDLNEWYSDRTGTVELASAKRNEGGFVHVAPSLEPDEADRNTFKCDMLITGAREVDADEERGLPAKVIVKGAIFNFRKALLPVEFSVLSDDGMSYFLGLNASNANPTFTQVWGNQVSETIVRKEVTKSAFGPDQVREVINSRRDFVISGSNPDPYVWDDESTLTAQEVTEAVATRETYLATLKQRYEEFKNSRNAAPKAAANNSGFNF